MRLLQRYIVAELFKVFGVVLTAMTLLLVFVGVFGLAKEHNLGIWQLVQILPFVAPSLLPFTIPATLLLAVCVVYGRLAADREIIAAKSAGINIVALVWPAYALAAVLSVVSLFLVDRVIPWSMARIEETVTLAMEDIFLDMLKVQNQVNIKEHGLSISAMDVVGRTLMMPTFRYTRSGGRSYTITAEDASLDFDLPNREVVLRLNGVEMDIPLANKQGGQSSKLVSRQNEIRFPLPSKNNKPKTRALPILSIDRELRDISRTTVEDEQRLAIQAAFLMATGRFDDYNAKPFRELRDRAVDNENRYLRLRSEYHSRFALSASCFFFVLFGCPFAIWLAKSEVLTSFLFCFLPILTVYYPLVMMVQNLSKTNAMDPSWGSWLANVVLFAATAWVFPRVLRH